MTDTSAEPAADDADDYDGTPESVTLTRTGWLRAVLPDGSTLRLRRPFMGELKRLRMLLEEVEDELADESTRAQIVAQRLTDAAQADRPDGQTEEERIGQLAEMRRESRAAARRLEGRSDELRVGWWREAVLMLAVDDSVPVEFDDENTLPAWFLHPTFVHQALQHWRSVPLARG